MLDKIVNLFSPLNKLVDELHFSGEEKLKAEQAIFISRSQVMEQMLSYEKASLEARAKIVLHESTGRSWLQRNWRPLTMLTFLFLVICDSFGILPFRLASEAWKLLQLGLGGYVVGRSVEKVAPSLAKALSQRKK